MSTADGEITLVFNGEIYNYVELRAEVEQLGHRFRSSAAAIPKAVYRLRARGTIPCNVRQECAVHVRRLEHPRIPESLQDLITLRGDSGVEVTTDVRSEEPASRRTRSNCRSRSAQSTKVL
jgi:hypothetical protein